jgi:hypothetical protein
MLIRVLAFRCPWSSQLLIYTPISVTEVTADRDRPTSALRLRAASRSAPKVHRTFAQCVEMKNRRRSGQLLPNDADFVSPIDGSPACASNFRAVGECRLAQYKRHRPREKALHSGRWNSRPDASCSASWLPGHKRRVANVDSRPCSRERMYRCCDLARHPDDTRQVSARSEPRWYGVSLDAKSRGSWPSYRY